MNEDGGVLGRLPRSRPGTRSAKREAAEAAEKRGAKAARPSRQAQARPTPPPTREEAPQSGGVDPVGDVVRAGAKVAGTGVKVATGLTREVLRRIPRP